MWLFIFLLKYYLGHQKVAVVYYDIFYVDSVLMIFIKKKTHILKSERQQFADCLVNYFFFFRILSCANILSIVSKKIPAVLQH